MFKSKVSVYLENLVEVATKSLADGRRPLIPIAHGTWRLHIPTLSAVGNGGITCQLLPDHKEFSGLRHGAGIMHQGAQGEVLKGFSTTSGNHLAIRLLSAVSRVG